MKKIALKELFIYLIILIFLAYLMHGNSLAERLNRASQDISLFLHALIYAFLAYIFLLIPRVFIKILKNRILKR